MILCTYYQLANTFYVYFSAPAYQKESLLGGKLLSPTDNDTAAHHLGRRNHPLTLRLAIQDLRVARKIYQNRALLASTHGGDADDDDGDLLIARNQKLPGPIMEEDGEEEGNGNYDAKQYDA